MSGLSPEVRMAEDIARQFGHLPTVEAAGVVAAHILQFWSPAMRDNLITLDQARALSGVVGVAAKMLSRPSE